MANLLTMHSFEVESVKQLNDDWVLDISVLPNRAHDCLSHLGVARECVAILNSKLKDPSCAKASAGRQNSKLQLKNSELQIDKLLDVEVENAELCPRYCARVITELKIEPSPQWLQEKLIAGGSRPINNVVDATNYVMLECGQPLHAFDYDRLGGQAKKQIKVRLAKPSEKIITLDGQERELTADTLVIADAVQPIAVAGIMGGADCEVGEQTKNIVLESANFDGANILLSAKKLKVKTEASYRFEKGLDPNLAGLAIDRVAQLIKELAGGNISALVDIYPNPSKPVEIILSPDYLNSFLGIDISTAEVLRILRSLEFGAEKMTTDKILVTVPTWRLDIEREQDLVEEVARIYGYTNLPAVHPIGPLVPPQRNELNFYLSQARDTLASAGLSESYNHAMIGDREVKIFDYEVDKLAELQNHLNIEQKYLRPSLLPNLLHNIKTNLRYFNEIRLFEAGKIFNPPMERWSLAASWIGNESIYDLAEKKLRGGNVFYDLKGVLDLLFDRLGIDDVWYDDALNEAENDGLTARIFFAGHRAQIKIGDQLIGWLGEINPEILMSYDIDKRVAAFELDFEKLTGIVTEDRFFVEPFKYPAIIRDIALLVDSKTKIEQVTNVLENTGGPLVQDIDLFDSYEDESLPEDKKSLTFRVVYQSAEKTLSDGEVNKLHEELIQAVLDNGWEVRR